MSRIRIKCIFFKLKFDSRTSIYFVKYFFVFKNNSRFKTLKNMNCDIKPLFIDFYNFIVELRQTIMEI